MIEPLDTLLTEIRTCRVCAAHLPLGPSPVVQAGAGAQLRIIGQAPGRRVHESGVPWDDASGQRLRDWLELTPAQFYDPTKVAILPIGFCYPGKAASGDNPPRPECAPLWHDRLNGELSAVRLTLLIGQYAQARYLGAQRKGNLTETVWAWRDYAAAGVFPLPHPSPRNQPWFKQHPWFSDDLIPALRAAVSALDL